MTRELRRLRNLRFEQQDTEERGQQEENLQLPPEPAENDEPHEDNIEEQPEENIQDHPEIDVADLDIPPGSIKIVWPNGFVREVMGRFSISRLLNMETGKVLVETDENGVPNQKSASLLGSFLGVVAKNSSYAPLHIPRWDNRLFNTPKERLIAYVEDKFVYRASTRALTRDWILKVVSKRWRDYKSYLKKKYYDPNERSMDQIMRNAPPGINEHQWVALIGIWSQDQHKRTCQRNSEAGKQQRHPHTTGRKSHARLKREMEAKNNGPVHKIDLWDEAHKKKDGNYSNQSVLELMDKAYDKLADLKREKNGNLSSQDYDDVFVDVIAKETTAGGYYDEKYWNPAKFCHGSSSVGQSASEERVQNELEAVRHDLRIVTELADRMRAFIAQKYPDEDWAKTMVNISDRVGNGAVQEVDDTEESVSSFQTSANDPRQTYVCHAQSKEQFVISSASPEKRIQKVSKRKKMQKQHTLQEAHSSEGANNGAIQCDVNIEQSFVNQTLGNNPKQAYGASSSKHKKHRVNSSANEQTNVKKVVLLSMNIRAKGLVVGEGTLVSRDRTYVVGGNMLGNEFYGVTVDIVSELGSERLPRPYGNFKTVEDAVGHCIAWPRTHVKRVKAKSTLP